MDCGRIIFKSTFLFSLLLVSACQTTEVLQQSSQPSQTNGPLAQRFANGSSVNLIGGFQNTNSETQNDRTSFLSDVQFEGEWNIYCPVNLTAANTHLKWARNSRVRIKGIVQSQQKSGIVLRNGCTVARIDG